MGSHLLENNRACTANPEFSPLTRQPLLSACPFASAKVSQSYFGSGTTTIHTSAITWLGKTRTGPQLSPTDCQPFGLQQNNFLYIFIISRLLSLFHICLFRSLHICLFDSAKRHNAGLPPPRDNGLPALPFEFLPACQASRNLPTPDNFGLSHTQFFPLGVVAKNNNLWA